VRFVLVVFGCALLVLFFVNYRAARGVGSDSARTPGAGASDSPRDVYTIAVIADKDQKSRDGNKWQSVYIKGTLTHNGDGTFGVSWGQEILLDGEMNEAGRGMELSELVHFQNMLLTCDDRTGIIYEIVDESTVVPRYILSGGDGNKAKGFKCEWMTVKDGALVVGSTGKEWTTPQGVVLNHDPTWIKIIEPTGRVRSVEWAQQYTRMREATGTGFPGFVVLLLLSAFAHACLQISDPRGCGVEPCAAALVRAAAPGQHRGVRRCGRRAAREQHCPVCAGGLFVRQCASCRGA
jgi:hypothetical protein